MKSRGEKSRIPTPTSRPACQRRRSFWKSCAAVRQKRNRYGTQLSLAIVEFVEDLDDEAAHEAHARKSLLATISKLASSVLRDTDLIARHDSNSLSILLPATDLKSALVPLRRLRENTSNYTDVKYASLSYAVSIGAVEVLPDEHPGSALQRVDAALKSAIDAGGDCLFVNDGQTSLSVDELTLPTPAAVTRS